MCGINMSLSKERVGARGCLCHIIFGISLVRLRGAFSRSFVVMPILPRA